MRMIYLILLMVCLVACAPTSDNAPQFKSVGNGMPDIDLSNGIYEVAVEEGLSYEDVVDSLNSISIEMNFVNPANFPVHEQIEQRDIDPQGIKDVRAYCNLTMGTDIFLDHPEFLVFAPCRIAVYEKHQQLYLALARPTFDLKNIKNPTARAQQSAQQLEDALIQLLARARQGDF